MLYLDPGVIVTRKQVLVTTYEWGFRRDAGLEGGGRPEVPGALVRAVAGALGRLVPALTPAGSADPNDAVPPCLGLPEHPGLEDLLQLRPGRQQVAGGLDEVVRLLAGR